MVWALTPVDTVRGALPSRLLSPFRFRGVFFCEFGSINGLVNVLLLRFAGTQKYYIFAAGTYKVGRKGAPLDLTPLCVSYAVPCS